MAHLCSGAAGGHILSRISFRESLSLDKGATQHDDDIEQAKPLAFIL